MRPVFRLHLQYSLQQHVPLRFHYNRTKMHVHKNSFARIVNGKRQQVMEVNQYLILLE